MAGNSDNEIMVTDKLLNIRTAAITVNGTTKIIHAVLENEREPSRLTKYPVSNDSQLFTVLNQTGNR